MPNTIGLDFGTNYCRAAYLPGLIPNALGELVTPAWVGFSGQGQVMVGREAQPAHYAPAEMPLTGLKSMLRTQQNIWFGGGLRPPTEIAAYLFQALRTDAERVLDGSITGAVVSVPSLAGNRQRAATREAAELAGLAPVRLINEATAAALAYTQTEMADRRLLVYALGAGGFEAMVIEVRDRAYKTLALEGDERLGGNAFNRLVVNFLLAKIKQQDGIDLSTDSGTLWLLNNAVEAAKIKLSTETHIQLDLPELGSSQVGQAFNFSMTLTRPEIGTLLDEAIELTLSLTGQALDGARLTIADIDDMLLVGGSTRLPLVQQKLQDRFNKTPVLLTDDSVALGAAWQAAALGETLAAERLPEPEPIRKAVEAVKPEDQVTLPTTSLPNQAHPEGTPTLPPGMKEAQTLLHHAAQLKQANQWGEAIQALEQALVHDPDNRVIRQILADACCTWGSRLQQMNRYKEAVAILRTGQHYEPNHREIQKRLVSLHAKPDKVKPYRKG